MYSGREKARTPWAMGDGRPCRCHLDRGPQLRPCRRYTREGLWSGRGQVGHKHHHRDYSYGLPLRQQEEVGKEQLRVPH